MKDIKIDSYSMDMVNKFYENSFSMMKHVSWILIILNGTGAITLFSVDVSKYIKPIYYFSCGFLSITLLLVVAYVFMNPCCYVKNIRNIDKIMSIYKKFFLFSSFGMFLSFIYLMLGVNVAYNIII